MGGGGGAGGIGGGGGAGGAPEPFCGDGVLDEGESCDPGLDEACDALCTPSRYRLDQGRATVDSIETPAGAADVIAFEADGPSTYRTGLVGADLACPEGVTFTLTRDGAAVADAGCPGLDVALEAGMYELAVGGEPALAGVTLGHFLGRDVVAGGEFQGHFSAGGNDLYTITVAEPATVTFETSDGLAGCPGDTHLYAYTSDGLAREALADDDDSGQNLCSKLTLDLEPGVAYEVDVTHHFMRALDDYYLTVRFGVCGDGQMDVGEACDDGNVELGDGCNARCGIEPVCGNDAVERGEQCDDGNVDAGDGCDPLCQREPACGDGFVDGPEECDDSNVEAGDGCDADCQREPVCGDGFIDAPEQCDDSNAEAGDGCDADCQFEQSCGNGALEGTEQCDDGNLEGGDGCDVLCTADWTRIETGVAIVADINIAPEAADTFEFDAENPSHLSVATTDVNGMCPGDTRLVLLDAAGALVAMNDDIDEANPCSAIDMDVAPGTYSLRVESTDGLAEVVLTYRLEVDITAGGDFLGGFGRQGNDLYVLTLDAPGTVTFETSDGLAGCPPGDTAMRLFGFDEAGDREQLVYNDDGGERLCSRISQEFEAAGSYELEVSAVAGNPHAGYRLLVNYGTCGDANQDAGEACDDGNTDAGDGCSALCRLEPVCGNGAVELGEQCDDGNVDADDGCDAACQREPTCGDGFVDGPEECDDSNIEAGDGCDVDCQREPVCGDTFVDAPEQCDDGNLELGDGCDADCAFEQICGNGEVEGTEQCDDGERLNGDGCDADCTIEAFDIITGEAQVAAGFEVLGRDTFHFHADGPAYLLAYTSDGEGGCPGDTVATLYTLDDAGEWVELATNDDLDDVSTCSEIEFEVPEAGDYFVVVEGFDGAPVPAYAFDFFMVTDISAGGMFPGGFVAQGDDLYELVIDAPTRVQLTTGDGAAGCPDDTRMWLYQGDVEIASNDDYGPFGSATRRCSQIEAELEPGVYIARVDGYNGRAIDAYMLDVRFGGICGDGEINLGETCDNGADVEGDFCDAECQLIVGCGNGAIEDGESCDDGNVEAGDGCDAACQREQVCGDGFVDAPEGCDDGNVEAGDGCSADCQLEQECGNGEVEGSEACDDGNLDNADGCDAACTEEHFDIINGRAMLASATGLQAFDYYTFHADGPSHVTAWTGDGEGGCPNDTRMFLDAIDGEGVAAQVAVNDDANGRGACSQIDFDVEAGDYVFRVQGAFGRALEAYTFSFELLTDVTAGGDFAGGFVATGDDRFTFTLDAPTRVSLATSDGADGDARACPGDTRIEVLRDGERAAFNDDLPFGDALRPCSGLTELFAAGTYEVLVDGFNGAAVEAYALSATFGAVCGDGALGEGEGCDDGNLDAGDGCDASCIIEPGCGNNQIDDGEECDDGNLDLDDGCDADCQREPTCGDGFTDAPEQCDDGNVEAGDGCDDVCMFEVECGNARLEPGEDCDDGNLIAGDACAADCTLEAATPIAEVGETIENMGSLVDGDALWARPSSGCFPSAEVDHPYDAYRIVNNTGADQLITVTAAWAGDGFLHVFREPFNPVTLDGCEAGDDDFGIDGSQLTDLLIADGETMVVVASSYGADDFIGDWTIEVLTQVPDPVCGNAAVEAGEECDDGNVEAGDGCDDACQREPSCGDGFIDDPETCDDGNADAGDGCDADCLLEPACGNGQIDGDEACDDGNLADGDGCAADCTIEPCGNGVLDDGEACDDGNLVDGDTCSSTCEIEAALPIAAAGDMIAVEGSLDDTDGQWARPSEGCGASNGVDHFYDAFRIVNDTGADQALTITADWNGDGYLHVFRAPFDLIGLEGCELGDDDFGGAAGSQITDLAIADGEVLVVVASTFSANRATGAWGIEVLTQAPPAVCGNAEVEDGEQCDPGADVPDDFCSADCQLLPGCGNGAVDDGEQCDDGNADAGDGCDAQCQREQVCGDTFVDDPEECDDGNLEDGDGCSAACVFELACGNGNVDDGEACDDGNAFARDTCAADCTIEAATAIAANNEVVTVNGDLADGDALWARPTAACGAGADGRFFEAWRIVNNTGADQRVDVTAAWATGDGFLHVFTEPFDPTDLAGCVAGNDDFGDRTASQITDVDIADGEVLVVVASTWGAGATVDAYAIEIATQAALPVCGNGAVEDGETCDDGNLEAGDGCAADCTLEPFCGNGQLDAGEACDDGNDVEGDGCDNACTIDRFTIDNGRVELPGEVRGGSHDIFSMRVESPSALDAFTGAANGGCPGDTILVVYDVSGAERVQVARNNDAGGGRCSRVLADLAPGPYEIEVFTADDSDLDYQLTVRLTADVSAGGAFDGGFQAQGDDMYRFTLAEASQVRLQTRDANDGCPGDTRIEVTRNGAPITSNDDGGGNGLCSLIEEGFEAGEYLVKVDGFNNAVIDAYVFDVQFYRCGDGEVGGAEECDDGNDVAGDGCAVDCTIEPFCGDGTVDAGEACDDGNNEAGDGCAADCTNEVPATPIAAQGETIESAGAFEDGDRLWARPLSNCSATNGADHPYDTWRVVNTSDAAQTILITADWAGDGYLHVFSDPFDAASLDGCVVGDDDFNGAGGSQIELEIQPGETLVVVASTFDPADYFGAWGLSILTVAPPACGDGSVDAGEACDDGNLINGDGCDAICSLEAFEIIRGQDSFSDRAAAGSVDTYGFTAETTSMLTGLLSDGNGGCVGAPSLTLVDAQGAVVGAPAMNCDQLALTIEPGDYTLQVTGAAQVDAYQLDFMLLGDLGRGGDVLGGFVQNGNDLFTITLYGPGELTFATNDGAGGCPGDTRMTLSLVDANGALQRVNSNDDGGVGNDPCSQLVEQLAAGTYVVDVRGFGNRNVDAYTLSTTVPEGDAGCIAFADCLAGCGQDFVCLAGCQAAAPEPARELFTTVATCGTQSGCADLLGNYDLPCMAEACPAELSACFGPQGPAQ
jgi:cysteine-rich repeat protein